MSRLNQLYHDAEGLRHAKDYARLLPVCVAILEEYESHGGDRKRIGGALNYLSALCLRLNRLFEAESYARRSIATIDPQWPDSPASSESLATYRFLLARVLSVQGRFDEAVVEASAAIALFERGHSPDDSFLAYRRRDLEYMKAHDIHSLSKTFDF